MKGLLVAGLLLVCSQATSQTLSDLFSLEDLFQVDLDAYADPPFKWPADGKIQASLNDALFELKDGNIDQSVPLFEAALQLDSTFWPARYYYAISLRQTAQYGKSRLQLEKLIKLNLNLPEIHLEYGRLLQQGRKLNEAKAQYQLAIKLNPKFAKGYHALGIAFALNGDFSRARKNFDRCVELDSVSAEAYFGLGMLKLLNTRKSKNFDMSLINRALKVDPSYRPALFWRGLVEADKNNFEIALQDWTRLVQMSPGNPFMLNMRGFLQVEMERYEDAYADFKKAILMRRSSDDRYSTGRTPIDKSVDLQNALNYINQKGYGLKEQSFYHLRKGLCLMVINRNKEALESMNESVRIEPSAPGYLLKAIMFEKLYRDDSAQACYIKALKYDNDLFDAHKKRALHFVAENDWKSTYKEFNEMKRINPEANVTYRISGLIKTQFKDFYGCIIDLSRVLKQDSTDKEVWKARAICRSQVKDHPGALADIKQAVLLDSANKTLLLTQVYIELTSGDTLASKHTLRRAVEANPKDCDLWLTSSDYEMMTGDFTQATFAASQALKHLDAGTCEEPAYGFEGRIHALLNMAKGNKQMGQHEKALEILDQSLKGYYQAPELLFERALLLLDMNRVREAKSDLKKLREKAYPPALPYIDKYLK